MVYSLGGVLNLIAHGGCEFSVLLRLFILELLHDLADLRHAMLHLRHQVLFSVECGLLVASLPLADDIDLLLEPVLRCIVALHSE